MVEGGSLGKSHYKYEVCWVCGYESHNMTTLSVSALLHAGSEVTISWHATCTREQHSVAVGDTCSLCDTVSSIVLHCHCRRDIDIPGREDNNHITLREGSYNVATHTLTLSPSHSLTPSWVITYLTLTPSDHNLLHSHPNSPTPSKPTGVPYTTPKHTLTH